jgi:uncharacterized protein (TIGR02266 family)
MVSKRSRNILLADDSVFFRTNIGELLTEAGHRVDFANNGGEVINKLQENPGDIDLLTLDIEMPHIDGFGVLEWMSENDYIGRFPVLVITATPGTDEDTARMRSLGASGLMTKSYSHEQIVNCINRVLFTKDADARVEPRVLLSVSADFKLEDRKQIGFLLNISTTGLCLRTRKELKPGTALELKFTLPGSKTVLRQKGFVKWSAPSLGARTKLGIKFTSVTKEVREEIRLFVERENKIFSLDT